jgi:hypothetical protein
MCSMRGASARCIAAFVASRPVRSVASGKSLLIARPSAAVAARGAKYLFDTSSPIESLRRAAPSAGAGAPNSGSATMTGALRLARATCIRRRSRPLVRYVMA